MSAPATIAYADAAGLVADAFDALLPPEAINTAEFAEKHRYLCNEGGYVGMWQNDKVPYLRDPMVALDDCRYTTLCVVGAGQSAKTEIAQNWLLKNVCAPDPGNTLWYMQNQAAIDQFVKTRLNPMIAQHPAMRDRLGSGAMDNSLKFKQFDGMWLELLPAAENSMIGKSAPRIVADEVDAMRSVGDVKSKLDVRRQTYGDNSMMIMMSHPDLATGLDPEADWHSGIMSVYADSTRSVWYWRCPHCDGYSSTAPTADRVMVLDYPHGASLDEIEAEARLVCPCCRRLIGDECRREMNRTGVWVGRGQSINEAGVIKGELTNTRTAGYWITGLMSTLNRGIGSLARARVKAERDLAAGGDDDALRQVVVKQWGLPYRPPRETGSIDARELSDAADATLVRGRVANGVRFLTAGIDVQNDRFEILVRGWCAEGRSVVVDYSVIPCRPATESAAWDLLVAAVVTRRYPLADNSGRVMAIRAIGYDSAGAPGVTLHAGDAWRRWKLAGLIRLYGQVSGRDAWSIVPTKGASGFDAPRIVLSYPETQRQGRLASRGSVPQLMYNANLFKDDLAGQLCAVLGEPWSVRFPADLRAESGRQGFFDQLVSERRDIRGRWAKEHAGIRNEALDLMVINHTVARLHGVGRIDWANPPPWAAEWGENSMVTTPPAEAAPVPAAVPPTHAEVPAAQPAKRVAGLSQDEETNLRNLLRRRK
jgi:phage terminase large subunit GpA-like protein